MTTTASATTTTVQDDTQALQQLIDQSTSMVYIPAGIWHISAPLLFPYDTVNPYTVSLDPAAVIIATQPMSSMLSLGGGASLGGEYTTLYTLSGGKLDGNHLAETGVECSSNISGYSVSNIVIYGCTTTGILCQTPSTGSLGAQISHIRINQASSPVTSIGISLQGDDWMLQDVRTINCETGVRATGEGQAVNLRLEAGSVANTLGAVGLQAESKLHATQITVKDYPVGLILWKEAVLAGITACWTAATGTYQVGIIAFGNNPLQVEGYDFLTPSTAEATAVPIVNNESSGSVYQEAWIVNGLRFPQSTPENQMWAANAIQSGGYNILNVGNVTLNAGEGMLLGWMLNNPGAGVCDEFTLTNQANTYVHAHGYLGYWDNNGSMGLGSSWLVNDMGLPDNIQLATGATQNLPSLYDNTTGQWTTQPFTPLYLYCPTGSVFLGPVIGVILQPYRTMQQVHWATTTWGENAGTITPVTTQGFQVFQTESTDTTTDATTLLPKGVSLS